MAVRGPLSFAQQRMLRFLEGPLDPLGFHLTQYVELEGELDTGALEAALAHVAARHPALRTAFRRDGGELGQEIEDAVEIGRASCRGKCRSRWSPDPLKKKKKRHHERV